MLAYKRLYQRLTQSISVQVARPAPPARFPAQPLLTLLYDTISTLWASNGIAVPAWLEYDFGTAKVIRQYVLKCHSANANAMPRDWTIEYYDGVSWQTADTQSGVTWVINETKTYQIASAYSSDEWRINITAANGGSNFGIYEMEMMEAATTSNDSELAQSFEVTGSQTVGTVDLWLKKVGSPTGNLTVEIQTDSTGEPSGTAISNGTSGTVAASTLTTSYADITFTFGTPPSLSGSTTYWLVLKTTDSASDFNFVQWGADGSTPSYADGEMLSYDGAAWNAESKDAVFEVVAPGSAFVEPANAGFSTAGGTDGAPRVVYAHHDGSYADASTKSTVKNISGGSLDLTFVVEVE